MIVLKLQGGLGNQMFEYAFARTIQEQKKDKKLILDTSDFQYDKQREYSLGHFILNENIEIDSSGKFNLWYDQRKNPLLKVGFKFWPKFQFQTLKLFGIYVWDYAKYIPVDVSKKHKNILLHGLWQSDKYFSQISEIIRKEFAVKDEPSQGNKAWLERISSANAVCVHIRRGDFLAKGSVLLTCSNSYYLKAMEIISKKVNEPEFFIFSDDIEDVKKIFEFPGYQITLVNQSNPDYEELSLMSKCKHFIIANSTFSWWSSLLSENEDKVIVAPRLWYSDGRDTSALMRDEWIIIDNE